MCLRSPWPTDGVFFTECMSEEKMPEKKSLQLLQVMLRRCWFLLSRRTHLGRETSDTLTDFCRILSPARTSIDSGCFHSTVWVFRVSKAVINSDLWLPLISFLIAPKFWHHLLKTMPGDTLNTILSQKVNAQCSQKNTSLLNSHCPQFLQNREKREAFYKT